MADRTSAEVTTPLFDLELRAVRRDRASRSGATLFLHERAFEDILDRLAFVSRTFRSALLLGCPDPSWPARLATIAGSVTVVDPGPSFAAAAGGRHAVEDQCPPLPADYDLCVAVGTLDTVNDLPRVLQWLRSSMTEDAFLIGAMAGGDTLPNLRRAMHAADQARAQATPHVHPRIEAPSLAALLGQCGFVLPVVDVDRVRVTYPGLTELIGDLRRMAATNILHARSRAPLDRASKAAAEASFRDAGDGRRTIETFEILHFAGWTQDRVHRHG